MIMHKSDSVGKVLAKIGAVSNDMSKLVKSANNPFFKSKYVKLEAVQEELAPKLIEHKLSVSQPLFGKGIMTIVSDDESGEWVGFPTEINNEHLKPQDQMSGVTYMKRYSLVGTFNLQTSDEDDDGNKVSTQPAPRKIANTNVDYPEGDTDLQF